MEPARRARLLSQARPFRTPAGECLFPEAEVPKEVFLIIEGTVCVYADMPAEDEPVFLAEHGPGACVGWSAAISAAAGIRAMATSEVSGIAVPATVFMGIARYDKVLGEAVLSKAWKGEVWRAILAEMERRTGRIVSAAGIVERIFAQCVIRESPGDLEEITASKDRAWVVAGGEGVTPGDRWRGGDGVVWARLVGLPEPMFTNALLEKPAETGAQTGADTGGEMPAQSGNVLTTTPPPVAPAKRSVRRSGGPLRAIEITLTVILLVAAAVAAWASRQHITKRVSFTGRLIFAGESRTITAGVGGALGEFNLREGERIQGGATLAVVRPPLDENSARKLIGEITRLKKDAAFCEAALAGKQADVADVSPSLVALTRQHAELSGELRVLAAIERADENDPTLNPSERARVAAHFANIRRTRDERQNSVFNDASARNDDLREAENALRDAQEELSAHVQAFSGVTSGDKESAEQELRDYRRILGTLNRSVATRRDAVGRIRREIAALRSTVPPPVSPEQSTAGVAPQVLRARNEITSIGQQIMAASVALQRDIAAAQEKLSKIQDAAAPRQVKAVQPGYIIEAAKLAPGALVRPETALGRIITRNAWQIDCSFPPPQTGKIEPGQELAITVADRYATLIYDQFSPHPDSATRANLRESRDDWRNGMAVRVETTVITGSLLEEWMRKAGVIRN